MPIISSYPINTDPSPTDIIVGTDVSNGRTKNFTVKSLSDEAINKWLEKVSWQFITTDPETPSRPVGSISFQNYGGNNTQWSNINTIYINTTMAGNALNSLPYLQRIIGSKIIIQDRKDISRYGVYELTSLTQVDDTTVYTMSLSFLEGNATIVELEYYSIQIDLPGVEGDKHFTFEQGVGSNTWDIEHNLNKFPSVTVVDTQNTSILGGQVDYINANRLIITFLTSFAGKAFLN